MIRTLLLIFLALSTQLYAVPQPGFFNKLFKGASSSSSPRGGANRELQDRAANTALPGLINAQLDVLAAADVLVDLKVKPCEGLTVVNHGADHAAPEGFRPGDVKEASKAYNKAIEKAARKLRELKRDHHYIREELIGLDKDDEKQRDKREMIKQLKNHCKEAIEIASIQPHQAFGDIAAQYALIPQEQETMWNHIHAQRNRVLAIKAEIE